MRARIGLRSAALVYLLVILVAPVAMVFYRTFQHGLEPVWAAVSNPDAQIDFSNDPFPDRTR